MSYPLIPDAYAITLVQGRTLLGRRGWRLQVYLLGGDKFPDRPLLRAHRWALGPWSDRGPLLPTRDEALDFGIEVARDEHREWASDRPLLIMQAGDVIVDEPGQGD